MFTTKSFTNLSKLSSSEKDSIKKINEENMYYKGGTLYLSNILRFFDDGDIILLAYDNNEVVGYALIKKPNNVGVDFMKSCAGEIKDDNFTWDEIVSNTNALYIAQIAIACNHQGNGVATAMIESMNDFIVISNAKVKNKGSHNMHIKNGFKVIGGMYAHNNEPYNLLYYREKKCV